MTYCVGLRLDEGLVMLSDTRTNAGVDNISTFCKMHVFEVPGERVIVLLTAGNLALSQAVVTLLKEGVESDGAPETLPTVPSLLPAAPRLPQGGPPRGHTDPPPPPEQTAPFDHHD